jgi:hypothetical protein
VCCVFVRGGGGGGGGVWGGGGGGAGGGGGGGGVWQAGLRHEQAGPRHLKPHSPTRAPSPHAA